jgi:hypothetical protein
MPIRSNITPMMPNNRPATGIKLKISSIAPIPAKFLLDSKLLIECNLKTCSILKLFSDKAFD